ncbi:MAG: hypothetical protein KAT05_07350 [Spirochaetes bacterium]|nr:hypothetical protein [Spirochaetota bacterium]
MKKTSFIVLVILLLFLTVVNTLTAMETIFEKDGKTLKMVLQATNDIVVSTYPKPDEDFELGRFDEDVAYKENLWRSPSEYLGKTLGFNNLYFIRIDLSFRATLSPYTNLYYLMAFRVLNQDSGNQNDFNYVLLNAEVEHLYKDMVRFRIGRLMEKYSESRFFGRIALGYKDVHVFGRTPFINDAIEVNLDSKNTGLPLDFSTGVKLNYKPIEFSSYFFITQYKKKISDNSLKAFFIYSYNRQHIEDVAPILPSLEGDRYYHGLEGEVSFNIGKGKITPFVNTGFLHNYIGYMIHCAGPRDILKMNEPRIIDADDSISQTMTHSLGINIRPFKFSENLSFFKQFVIEYEYIPAAGDNETIMKNTYTHFHFTYNKLAFHYGLAINKIEYLEPTNLKNPFTGKILMSVDELNNYTHYFRITTGF